MVLKQLLCVLLPDPASRPRAPSHGHLQPRTALSGSSLQEVHFRVTSPRLRNSVQFSVVYTVGREVVPWHFPKQFDLNCGPPLAVEWLMKD